MDVGIDPIGDEDAAWRRGLLQARGNVHSGAVDVLTIDHDLADVYADPQRQTPVLGHRGIASAHLPLHGDADSDRVDYAGELDQHAVAHKLDDAAIVLGDRRVDQLISVGLKGCERGGFVFGDEAAVFDHIGRDDRGKLADDVLLRHALWPVAGILTGSLANYRRIGNPPRRSGSTGSWINYDGW